MADKLNGGAFAVIARCVCCGDRHRSVEVFPPPVPGHLTVFQGYSRDNFWYLCPSFLYAVPYALKHRRWPSPRRPG